LSFYYGFSKTKTEKVNSLVVWFSILFHLGLAFLAVWQFKHRIFISVGILWYLSSIILFSNWLELVAGMVGERLAFAASAGFSIFLASLILWIKPNFNLKKPRGLEVAFLIVLGLFIFKTIQRNTQWKNPITLMGNDIKHLQKSAQANNLYAQNLMKISTNEDGYSQEQRLEMQKTAVKHFQKAVNIYPNFSNAWFDLGRSAFIIGDTISAIKGFENSISLNPQNLDAYYLLLNLFEIKSSWDKHLKYSLLLFEINKDPSSYILLSLSFVENNKFNQAKQILKQGINSFPRENRLKDQYESLMLIKRM
jgi:tetratricopeptide (TPR) repeat protein